METPLQILHLEPDRNDAGLIQAALEKSGIACAVKHVKNRTDFVAALERGGFDLVLSEHALPALDGLAALEMTRAKWPAIPFIVVSGAYGDEPAVEALKRGATDYISKPQLPRLAPAIRRALQEAETRVECHRLKRQLIESQKMEVLGRLVGGVAHDFNNVLGVIIGYSDMLRQQLDPGHPLLKYAQEIRRAGEHAALLTKQLLIFSRKQTVQPVVLDLNEAVKDLDTMLRRLINENIELTLAPGEEIGRIKADLGQVGQVLVNLVVNARDAMPDGGQLTIATRNVTLHENSVRSHPEAAPGAYVILAVSDTGVGMTDEVKAHLFQAFFTTKPEGKGTGLGLATSQLIVKQSGGFIAVDSEPGKGTTFKVHFQRVDEPLSTAARPEQKEQWSCGTETVLVVEDEPAVCNLANNVLKNQGYTVLRAMNGQEALRVAREHNGPPIRLVITDIVMPQMGGKVMAEWLKSRYPDLKIIFTSGYTDAAVEHNGNGASSLGVTFLPKPYTPATLTRKVREMLDAS